MHSTRHCVFITHFLLGVFNEYDLLSKLAFYAVWSLYTNEHSMLVLVRPTCFPSFIQNVCVRIPRVIGGVPPTVEFMQ